MNLRDEGGGLLTKCHVPLRVVLSWQFGPGQQASSEGVGYAYSSGGSGSYCRSRVPGCLGRRLFKRSVGVARAKPTLPGGYFIYASPGGSIWTE